MWPADPLEVHLPDLSLLATVRDEVEVAAGEWSDSDVDALVLIVDELAVNGVAHAGTPVVIDLDPVGDGAVRVAVTDSGAGWPRVTHDDSADHGRGLAIVEALATRWGVERSDAGKTVWAVVPPSAA